MGSPGNERRLPVIGITVGDPAGIGPEISLKTAAETELRECCTPLLIGDARLLDREAGRLGLGTDIRRWTPGSGPPDAITGPMVLDIANFEGIPEYGRISAEAGKAASEYIRAAVDLWRSGAIDAVTTAPINKASIAAAGVEFPGHTEFLADLTGAGEVRMSFVAGGMWVVLLSTHISLRAALDRVKEGEIEHIVRFVDRVLSELLGKKVRIAVAGLNPHASDLGMFGSEEEEEIAPAVESCRESGIDVSGPYSPDTVFLRAHRGEFDSVVSCYHDQATIAVKCLSFGRAVNVTLGLPLLRTSVDHGTAFDIAGEGKADNSSLTEAVKLAAELVGISSYSSRNA